MKVEARIKFFDIENNKQLRKKGEQFGVSEIIVIQRNANANIS